MNVGRKRFPTSQDRKEDKRCRIKDKRRITIVYVVVCNAAKCDSSSRPLLPLFGAAWRPHLLYPLLEGGGGAKATFDSETKKVVRLEAVRTIPPPCPLPSFQERRGS